MVYSFPAANAVITSLSPATIGEESPLGTGTFHFAFLSGPNSTGGFAWSATPDPLGPRHRGHSRESSALSPQVVNHPAASTAIRKYMRNLTFFFLVFGLIPLSFPGTAD